MENCSTKPSSKFAGVILEIQYYTTEGDLPWELFSKKGYLHK
jgi:hypothetical protein